MENCTLRRQQIEFVSFALLAFMLLTVRFSPNWVAFLDGVRPAKVSASNLQPPTSNLQPPTSNLQLIEAIHEAILGGNGCRRGFFVMAQTKDLNAEIDDVNHKVVRWRLLMPALGYFLGLPGWLVLAFAHLGSLALIFVVVAIGGRFSAGGRPTYEAMCLGVVAGATAPFFTSMGWLGYYDSWLALALLGVAFARQRWVVVVACLLAPWIDERFVIGLPLALCVRRVQSAQAMESNWVWFRNQAVIPLVLASCYAVVRLRLGGSGGSQTVAQYLDQFVLADSIPALQRLFGAWSGLRLGWLLVAGAILAGWLTPSVSLRAQVFPLAAGVIITGLVGLFSALDMSRSMVLLIPVMPLGWGVLSRAIWWKKFHVAPLLAAAALAVPASHVVGKESFPVDNLWSPSLPLMSAQNNIGVTYARGDRIAKDPAEAEKWYRKSAELGYAVAQSNLGVLYGVGDGVPKDNVKAVEWFRRAAAQDYAPAQDNLGRMYTSGEGVAKDPVAAAKWFRKAAEQGMPDAQLNLGIAYAIGSGVATDKVEAARWYRKAAEQGNASAQNNLGVMYATGSGVPKDLVQAHHWLSHSLARGHATAAENLEHVSREMTPEQVAQAVGLRSEMLGKLSKLK